MTEETNDQKRPGPGRPASKRDPEQADYLQMERSSKKRGSQEQERAAPKESASLINWQSRILLFVGIMACVLFLTLIIVILSGKLERINVGSKISDVMPATEVEPKEPDLLATFEALKAQIEEGTPTPLAQLQQAIKTVEGMAQVQKEQVSAIEGMQNDLKEVATAIKEVDPTNTPIPPTPTLMPPTPTPNLVVESSCFPEVGWIAPKPLKNGEWLYDCLSAGEGNWIMPSDEWRVANWEKGKDVYEIVNVVIPDGASTLGLGCIPCTILKPDGETISPTDTDFGPFDPNLSLPVIPGEVYKVRTFGAEECSIADGPCPPSIAIWFNVGASSQGDGPIRFASKGGIPDGSNFTVEVNPGELHLFTAGPVCVLGTCLSGGETRASVLVMQSTDTSYTVELTGLVAYSNWYGAYKAGPEAWDGLINATVDGMKKPGNCTDGKLCETVDLVIVDAGAIVQREVR